MASPLFNQEGPQFYAAAFGHNVPFAVGGPYQTNLGALEPLFRSWVSANNVPFNPSAPTSDYDMRGFWQAMRNGQVPPWNGGNTHFPDMFKTPYDTSFSAESKYANVNNPFVWRGDTLVDSRNGLPVFRSGVSVGPNLALPALAGQPVAPVSSVGLGQQSLSQAVRGLVGLLQSLPGRFP